jgi:pyridoxal phosphate enzyme (YggS family)
MIRENYREITERIRSVNPSCRLVAVTKGKGVPQIRELMALGQRDFGESRVQELAEKARLLEDETKEGKITWHLVGHLQRNKAAKAVALCGWIHSIDSLKLAEKVNRAAADREKVQKCLVQVNITGEENKHGLKVNELSAFFSGLRERSLSSLDGRGLMAIGPEGSNKEIRASFRQLKEVAERLKLDELSVGMSSDYEIALEEGATFVRIGRALFR